MFCDESAIRKLEEMVISQIIEFRDEFQAKFPDESINEHLARNWTLYMLGKAKGISLENWKGVLPLWIRKIAEDTRLKLEPVHESWYRIDLAAVELFNGKDSWWSGKYKLHLLLEHENNPEEIAGHTRSLIDFNVPDKILISWTNHKYKDPNKLLDNAVKAVQWCDSNDVELRGNLTIIVGDWAKLEQPFQQGNKVSSDKILHFMQFEGK